MALAKFSLLVFAEYIIPLPRAKFRNTLSFKRPLSDISRSKISLSVAARNGRRLVIVHTNLNFRKLGNQIMHQLELYVTDCVGQTPNSGIGDSHNAQIVLSRLLEIV